MVRMQNKKAEKEFFDDFAAKGEYDVFDDRGYARILTELSRLSGMHSETDLHLLDVGCGTGAFTKRLSGKNVQVFGLDISHRSAVVAGRVAPECCFLAGDAENLPFRNDSLDIVLFSGVLHHLPAMNDALAQGFKVLKPGGCFLAFDPNGLNPAMWLYRSPMSPLATRKGWTENERLLMKDQIVSALNHNGFTQVIVRGISGVTYKYIGAKMAMKILKIYNIFDIVLDSVGLAQKYGSFLISYGRKPDISDR